MTVAVKQAGASVVDLLYTSNRGGQILLDLNGKALSGSVTLFCRPIMPLIPIAWRQWHHWGLMKDFVEVKLQKGIAC